MAHMSKDKSVIKNLQEGLLQGTALIFFAVGSLLLMFLIFVREHNWELALKEALEGGDGAVVGIGLNSTSELDTRTMGKVGGHASALIAELATLKQEFNMVRQDLLRTESERDHFESIAKGLKQENSIYVSNSSQYNTEREALEAKHSSEVAQYKRQLADKRLQRDAYLHKLKELGVDTAKAKDIIREQVTGGVGVGAPGTRSKARDEIMKSKLKLSIRGKPTASKSTTKHHFTPKFRTKKKQEASKKPGTSTILI